jgi:ribonuclease BN (tRNA processing enzyme)
VQLVVLGSGTCIPSGARSSSGYWIEEGELRLRLDCGSGSVHAMARYDLPWQRLTHQFISHFHLDHVGELPALLFAFKVGCRAGRGEPLTLLGPSGLRDLVEGWSKLYRYRLLDLSFPVAVRELSPDEAFPLGPGAVLRVAKAPHTAESLAVRIEAGGRSIAYTGDTSYSGRLVEFFDGVDLLVCECSFLRDDHGTAHLCIEEAASLASEARVRHLLASHSYFDPEAERLAERLAASYGGRVTIASDGLRIEVGA